MPRSFAVESELRSVVPDIKQSAGKTLVGRLGPRRELNRQGDGVFIRGAQWILRKQMQDIGQQQFLVLLFVVTAQFDDAEDVFRRRSLQQFGHSPIHMLAKPENVLERRPREQAAQR